MDKGHAQWEVVPFKHCADPSVDEASAQTLDGETLWLHCYFVWAHLAVYATISGPTVQVRDAGSWAHSAVSTLALVVQ
jgi:hypothetical protein